ncbi:hypothetical protein C1H46_000681 [Malus baccata]|uniref:Uncharacterized protein n=1 Tax=Malus baccata TaxID=106549 RepID=A0A540NRL3_MALBA|nr:hypothetical protein C1H46_000681 [Malus baccata]
MELSDIKRRQSRHASGSMFSFAEGDHSGELVADVEPTVVRSKLGGLGGRRGVGEGGKWVGATK